MRNVQGIHFVQGIVRGIGLSQHDVLLRITILLYMSLIFRLLLTTFTTAVFHYPPLPSPPALNK